MAKGKKKKGGKMCETVLTIKAGCGRGRKCDISLYITPQGSTTEYFNQYTAKRLADKHEDDSSFERFN
jgi:hypothetical protein